MTVYTPQGKIPKKVSIPIICIILAAGIGVWFLPVYGYYFEQRLWKYFLNGLLTLSALTLSGMLAIWAKHGDCGGDTPQ